MSDKIKLPVYSIAEIPRIWVIHTTGSSNIKFAAYDAPNKQMYLQFQNSEDDKPKLYRYNEVDLEFWVEFSSAESMGKFFHKSKSKLENFDTVKLKKKKD